MGNFGFRKTTEIIDAFNKMRDHYTSLKQTNIETSRLEQEDKKPPFISNDVCFNDEQKVESDIS